MHPACDVGSRHDPACFSIKYSGFRALNLLVSTIHPLRTISSRIKCAFSRLNMMSNSHTFSKYLSNVSTSVWMNSSRESSFSDVSHPMMKYLKEFAMSSSLIQ